MTLSFVKSPPRIVDILENGASVELSAEMAEHLLKECPYDGQRPLNEDRALLLATAIEHGTFLQNTQIAFGLFNGRYYLVNGQHRLNAVALARLDQRFRVEIYECDTKGELDAVYCRFDQPGGQRSLTQVSRALGLHDEGEGGLRPATAALLLRATPLLMMRLQRVAPIHRARDTRDLDAKKAVALQWKPYAINYQDCLYAGITNKTARYRAGGVFAVALVTLRYQNERAKEFWKESIRNSGLRNDDPRYALHSHFLSQRRATSENDLAEVACHAWNAFFRGKRLTTCKVLGGPLRVLGTPYGEE